MTHVAPELLAGVALGDPDDLGADDRKHLDGCAVCLTELADLTSIMAGGREHRHGAGLAMPDPRVWQRIQAELALRDPGTAVSAAGANQTESVAVTAKVSKERVRPGRREPAPRRLRRSVVVLAAGLGVLVGSGGTLLAARIGDRGEVLFSTPLTALPGESGSGIAQLVRRNGVEELRIRVDGPVPATQFRELWLLNNDGRRMYALGVLPSSGRDSYLVPSALGAALQGYTVVDISYEPYDGDAAHSGHSVLRGTLPG